MLVLPIGGFSTLKIVSLHFYLLWGRRRRIISLLLLLRIQTCSPPPHTRTFRLDNLLHTQQQFELHHTYHTACLFTSYHCNGLRDELSVGISHDDVFQHNNRVSWWNKHVLEVVCDCVDAGFWSQYPSWCKSVVWWLLVFLDDKWQGPGAGNWRNELLAFELLW